MKVEETETVDLSTSIATAGIELNGQGPVSVQPVLTALVGSPTYTLEVSNDNESYVAYDNSTTDIDLSVLQKNIQINYDEIPWWYMRLSVTEVGGSTGSVVFKVYKGIHRYPNE